MSGPCTDCGGPDYQTLVARIAEWEAALAAEREALAALGRSFDKERGQRQKAEAALAALKADVWGPDERRCETCKWWDLMSEPVPDDPRFHHACVKLDDQGRVYFPPDFACNRWVNRSTP